MVHFINPFLILTLQAFFHIAEARLYIPSTPVPVYLHKTWYVHLLLPNSHNNSQISRTHLLLPNSHNNSPISRTHLLLPNLVPIQHIIQEIYCPILEHGLTVHHPQPISKSSTLQRLVMKNMEINCAFASRNMP
jgi:hypothetical protein